MILRGDFSSDVLRTTINIQYMIPENCTGPYKTVYLLHGLHANQGTWIDNSMLPYYGKKYDAVFIMPETGRSYYSDLKYGRRFYTFISEELPQITKNVFNISSRREDTAVIGYSMGGNGALRLALSRPEQYGFCGSISAVALDFKPMLEAIRKDKSNFKYFDDTETEEFLKDLHSMCGEDLMPGPEGFIPDLIERFPDNAPKPKFFVTCGTEDSLLKENHKFRERMTNTHFDFTYEEWAGNHDWEFFNGALKKTLAFWYSKTG